jgi:hypothetical protein
MKKIKVLCFLALLFSLISCNKNDNPNETGYADKVVGTYLGTMYHGGGQLPCTSKINKNADTEITLIIVISGSSFTFGKIAVMNGGKNTYSLTYTDPSGSLYGKVEGDVLNYSVTSGYLNDVFTGTR